MTELRRRMIQDMTLRGLAPSTQQKYIEIIRALSRHYNCRPPQDITEEEVRRYVLYLLETRGLAKGTVRMHFYAIKFLYQITLRRNWRWLKLMRIRSPRKKLPVVLSRQEVWAVLNAVRRPLPRAALTLMYACGLRVSETTHLRVADIDTRRMVVCVTGKGGKQRHVPLPGPTLEVLRAYYRKQPRRTWLFPGRSTTDPIAAQSLRSCLKAAAREVGIQKNISCHTLRHSYATHLLDQKVDIRVIQTFLGHKSLNTTTQYLHMTQSTFQSTQDLLHDLMTPV
jgi:site-specific recombinase XerD